MTYLIDKTTTTREQFKLEANDLAEAKKKVQDGKGESVSSHSNESYSVRQQSPALQRIEQLRAAANEKPAVKESTNG